jgi:two-component system, sporulation sensor kinase E
MGLDRLPHRGWLSYVVAGLLVLAAMLVREMLLPQLGRTLPYVTFYPAVLAAALFGGFAAGLATTVTASFAGLFWVVGVDQLAGLSAIEWVVHVAFPLIGLLIAFLCEALYRSRAKDKERNRQLTELTDELTRQKQKYQTLVENIPDMITRFDKQLRPIYANPALEKTADPQTTEMYAPFLAHIATVFQSKQSIEYNSDYDSPHGARHYHNLVVPEFGLDGTVQSVLVVTRDITLQRQTENELLKLDRLNVIGEMAASIGHEIRNPLTTVRGYLQMFAMKGKYAGHKQQLSMMIEELDRANSIISDFLSLSKRKAVALKYDSLNDNIKGIVPLLQVDALYTGHTIKVELNDIPDIAMDKKEIMQILLNLVRNGVEATPAGGTVTVRTDIVDGQVVLSVRDTGRGIPKDIIDKLGTPFVTTKENGTGLGLPVCYRIAERHNAKIEVATSAQGTTFSVKFKEIRRAG